ncbi:MAG: putative signal transducing protein [Terriglobia bacterium]
MASCPKCGTGLPEEAGRCPACGAELEQSGGRDDSRFESESSEPEQRLVTVRSFSGPRAFLAADMAKSFLEAEGIPCMVPGQGSASVLPGVDTLNLLVREKDAEPAAEILKSLLDNPLEDTSD